MINAIFLVAEAGLLCIALLIGLGLVKAVRIWRESNRNEHKYQVMHAAIEKMRAHEAHQQRLYAEDEQQPTWPELRKAYKEYTEETE